MNEFYKVQLSSLYGKFLNRYVVYKGFRGSGRLYAASQRFGCDELLGKLILLRVKYPLWYEGDELIRELQRKLWIIRNRGGGV